VAHVILPIQVKYKTPGKKRPSAVRSDYDRKIDGEGKVSAPPGFKIVGSYAELQVTSAGYALLQDKQGAFTLRVLELSRGNRASGAHTGSTEGA
jgi:hypothetical protein